MTAHAKASISEFMTAQPHSIGQEQTLAAAADQMRKLNVRHLPVLHGGKLVGLADPLVVVPSDVTARIQEMHILCGHMLCDLLEQAAVK